MYRLLDLTIQEILVFVLSKKNPKLCCEKHASTVSESLVESRICLIIVEMNWKIRLKKFKICNPKVQATIKF